MCTSLLHNKGPINDKAVLPGNKFVMAATLGLQGNLLFICFNIFNFDLVVFVIYKSKNQEKQAEAEVVPSSSSFKVKAKLS